MNHFLFILCLLANSVAIAAQTSLTAVRHIELPDARNRLKPGLVSRPQVFYTATELATHLQNESITKDIERQVNFAEEKVFCFHWLGNPGDSLTATTVKHANGLQVMFVYSASNSADHQLAQRQKLFVLPANSTWSFIVK